MKEVKLKEGYYVMDPAKAVEMVDENTICVAAILGSTLTGEFEDVKLLNELLAKKNKETGWDTPIHVDAASGGFIAPFLYPELEWDFRLPLVKSINVSGHKYGLVYAGVGWVVWRSKDDLPEELIFHINYLGSDQPTFTLNFSKGKFSLLIHMKVCSFFVGSTNRRTILIKFEFLLHEQLAFALYSLDQFFSELAGCWFKKFSRKMVACRNKH